MIDPRGLRTAINDAIEEFIDKYPLATLVDPDDVKEMSRYVRDRLSVYLGPSIVDRPE